MIQYSAWLICYFGPYGYYGLWINVPNLCDVNKARKQTITLKITASFSVYIHIQSHGPDKSNHLQVKSTCFEEEPLEKPTVKVTCPLANKIQRNMFDCISDDWSATNHLCFSNTPSMNSLFFFFFYK